MKPLEVIAVDDASTDGTYAALLDLKGKHEAGWLKIVHLDVNRGAGGARNAGWNEARCDWIAFLDADASWHPAKLALQRAFMEGAPGVELCGHLHYVSPRPSFAPLVGMPTVRDIDFEDLFWKNRFITSSVMVRRELNLRFREGQRHMEDHALWLEVARSGHGIVRLEAALAAHHKPDFGASGLSAQLLAMEKAELKNYRMLHEAQAIGSAKLAIAALWSVLKFIRRLLLVGLRRVCS